MPKVTLGDVEIHYETYGTGTPVLLVPGLGGVGSYWNANIPAISQHHQVVVHDHRGTGQSSRSRIRYSVDQMSNDLLGLMDHLEIEQAHLVGHSTGGAIGQTLAVTNPERLKSLVIYASWTKADPFFRRVFEARRTLLTASGSAAYVRATPVFLYPDWWVNENIALLEEREAIGMPAFPGSRDRCKPDRRDRGLRPDRGPAEHQDADSGHLRERRHSDPALFRTRAGASDTGRRARLAGQGRTLRIGDEPQQSSTMQC